MGWNSRESRDGIKALDYNATGFSHNAITLNASEIRYI